MFFNPKEGRLPSLHFVTFSALTLLRAARKLALMNVLVAVHALRKPERPLEVAAHMAGNATHLGMFAQQRVLCLGMVELKGRQKLLPTRRGVALLALLLESSMMRIRMAIATCSKLHVLKTNGPPGRIRLMAFFARHLNMQTR